MARSASEVDQLGGEGKVGVEGVRNVAHEGAEERLADDVGGPRCDRPEKISLGGVLLHGGRGHCPDRSGDRPRPVTTLREKQIPQRCDAQRIRTVYCRPRTRWGECVTTRVLTDRARLGEAPDHPTPALR